MLDYEDLICVITIVLLQLIQYPENFHFCILVEIIIVGKLFKESVYHNCEYNYLVDKGNFFDEYYAKSFSFFIADTMGISFRTPTV